MASEPAVSIVCPTYAHGRYIGECLRSVVAQTFTDWELLVVDDGSPDNTLEQAATVEDPRIRVLPRHHVGIERLAETYNAGVEQARGSLIAVIEGDDRWPPDRLAHLVAIFREHPITVCYGRLAVLGARGRILAIPPLPGPVHSRPFDALGPMLLDSLVDPLAALVRRQELVAAGGFRQLPGHRHVDYATFVALAERGPFFATDRVVAHWRRHAGSATVQAVTFPWNFDGPRICRDHALAVRRRLSRAGLPSEAEIVVSWSRVLARRYWHGGRVLQAQRQWGRARELFIRGLRTSGATLRQRVLLVAGIVASLTHADLERLIGMARGGSSLSDL